MTILSTLSSKAEQITLSQSGKFLGVAYGESTPGVFNFRKKTLAKCEPAHKGTIVSVFFSHDENYFCSTSNDGVLKIFSLEMDNYLHPVFKFKCSIAEPFERTDNPQQVLKGMFDPTDTVIAYPGKPYLQVIENYDNTFNSTCSTNIRHKKDIVICHWINNNVLLTGGNDNCMSIWNYEAESQIARI